MTRAALGVVPALGRGALIRERLSERTLLGHAVDALRDVVDATLVVADAATAFPDDLGGSHRRVVLPADLDALRAALRAAPVVVVHDPLCPLTPTAFLADLAGRSTAAAAVVAGRPVTDTVKAVDGGAVTGTVDRAGLFLVTSPVVAPGPVLAGLDDLTAALSSPASLVAAIRDRVEVETVVAPGETARVEDADDARVLAALARPARHR